MQCAKLTLLVGYLTSRNLLHLHFEAKDWGSPIYVGPQSLDTICNRAPDSSKTKAKRVVLVKGPWYGTLGYLGLLFDLNRSITFLGLSKPDGALFFSFFFLDRPYFDVPIFFRLCR